MRDTQQQKYFQVIIIILCVTLTASFSGCSLLKPNAAKDSGFLKNTEQLQDSKEITAVWTSDKYKKQRDDYKQIMILPVNTNYLMKTGDWKHVQVSSEDTIKNDALEIAEFIEKEYRNAFRSGEVPQLALVNEKGADTMVLEVALTELVPTDVYRNAAGQVTGFFVPGGGLVSAGAGGSVAIELRIKDASTDEVLVIAKDRRVDKIAPVDIAGLTPYRHAMNNVDDWVKATVDALNAPVDEDVHIASGITLSPW